jgi:hypothetical protein
MNDEEEIELVMQIRQELRESKKAILKKFGLNLVSWPQIENRVVESFPDGGVIRGKYRFVVESHPIRAVKSEHAVEIGFKKRLTIHEL